MKSLVVTMLIMFSATAFASNDLDFKSPYLNKIVSIFAKYSPELVKEGSIEVSYCGTYGAVVGLTKATSKELAEKYILNAGSGSIRDIAFAALELKDDVLEQMEAEIDFAMLRFQNELKYASASSFKVGTDGLIFNYAIYPAAEVIRDDSTNEFLLISGDYWQDDCD